MNQPPPLALASSSRYRRALLARLGLPFTSFSPDIDEQRLAGERPATLVKRLARAKATAIAQSHPSHCVIGSDQALALGGEILGKPGDRAAAIAQLLQLSGQRVRFLTAVCIHHPGGHQTAFTDVTRVEFRPLHRPEIERYVDADEPFDCAGSLRSEALGIALCNHIRSQDPTALLGLPLIGVAKALREAGFPVP